MKLPSKHTILDDRRRIIGWCSIERLEWLNNEKKRIERVSGKDCEIVSNDGSTEYALFYKHGYYGREKVKAEFKWHDL